MALAELWFGQGRGVSDFICLGVRSGIGAGIVVDGQIYHGANNCAGQIGEWPCGVSAEHGASCTLEDVISFRSIQNRIGRSDRPCSSSFVAPGTEIPLEYFLQAGQAGNKLVARLLDRFADNLGLTLSQLDCVFDPKKLILAGAFPLLGETFLHRLNEALRRFSPPSTVPQVVYSTLGEFNGALGAAALAVHLWKPLRR